MFNCNYVVSQSKSMRTTTVPATANDWSKFDEVPASPAPYRPTKETVSQRPSGGNAAVTSSGQRPSQVRSATSNPPSTTQTQILQHLLVAQQPTTQLAPHRQQVQQSVYSQQLVVQQQQMAVNSQASHAHQYYTQQQQLLQQTQQGYNAFPQYNAQQALHNKLTRRDSHSPISRTAQAHAHAQQRPARQQMAPPSNPAGTWF